MDDQLVIRLTEISACPACDLFMEAVRIVVGGVGWEYEAPCMTGVELGLDDDIITPPAQILGPLLNISPVIFRQNIYIHIYIYLPIPFPTLWYFLGDQSLTSR